VSEVKRITLDAGQNLDRFESRYKIEGSNGKGLNQAIGIKRNPDSSQVTKPEVGTLRSWEPVKADGSEFGCAVVVAPDEVLKFADDSTNHLVITRIPADGIVTYHAGFGWSKQGFTSAEQWDRYVADEAQKIKSPLVVKLSK
jgi:hypothetical protein